MSAAFSRTLHAIDKDRVRVRGLFLLIVILLAWAGWLTMAKVAVYHSTMRARIEVQTAAHSVASEATGRVIESHLTVGAHVEVGDVLVMLDATTENQASAEARVRRQTNLDSCAAISVEVEAEKAAIFLAKSARKAAMVESTSRTNEAEIRNTFAGVEEGMLSTLRTQRAASELEYQLAAVEFKAKVSPAQRLGTVIPNDKLRAVAFFPTQSVGLLKIGQSAVIRLDGFPWMQFGSVPAVVENVGNEASSGVIRVERVLHPAADCPIPLAHGLPGSLQVQVERVSPATLILRAAGQYLASRKKPNLVADNTALSLPTNDASQASGSSASSLSRREQP